MTVVSADDVTFVPNRLGRLGVRDGIEPSNASVILKNFGECSECGGSLPDVDVKDALYEDRDVHWTDRHRRSSTHECLHCGADLHIMVEEKALGFIGRERLPDDPEESSLIFIPYNDDKSFVVVNEHQIFIREA